MLLIRDIEPYVVLEDDSVISALRRISDNKSGVVFCVTSEGGLVGSFTDGDFRRFITSGATFDPDASVVAIANLGAVRLPVDADSSAIGRVLGERITHVPLVDERGRLHAIATRGTARLRFGDVFVDQSSPTLVIAEIGINHNGSIERAFELVDAAAETGADCAKFQMRDLDSLYRNGGRPSAHDDLGVQYTLGLLERFSLSVDEMYRIFNHCSDRGLLPLCTPWDSKTVSDLEGWGVSGYKVASADMTNHDMLVEIAATGKPMLVSTGMSSEAEIVETVRVLRRAGAAFGLLHCNSAYPAPFKDVNLAYLQRLREIGECVVGYSGHERGFFVSVSAVALGAKVIEKHFTLDRALEGNDHKVSLLPHEFAEMVRGIRQVEESLGSDEERAPSQGELMNRATLSKSLVAAGNLLEGHVITEQDVRVVSPGRGLQPNRRRDLLGRTLRRSLAEGEYFSAQDAGDPSIEPRGYNFNRPWGVPVRFHDAQEFRSLCAPDLWEFHHSHRDLALRPQDFLSARYDTERLVVHSPELFEGDLTLDFATDDSGIRQRSVYGLRRVVDSALELREWFPSVDSVPIVVNCGGLASTAAMTPDQRRRGHERTADALRSVAQMGVELIPQTMPPFPWYFGGQQMNDLFVRADEIAWFCETFGFRTCFDLSHSKLSANHVGVPFSEFVEQVAPHAAHLHIVDATGIDGEGVQIGEGEIDFAAVCQQLEAFAPNVGFIPEIWQGHADEGLGFWVALDRLERWL